MCSLMTSGWRVRCTCRTKPLSGRACRRDREPHAVLVLVRDSGRCLVFGSYQRMPMSPVSKTSRSLSPTRSKIAWKSSSAAMPSWMLLMTASSALRCSVSFSSRCVSSKRRAFSSATLMRVAERGQQAARPDSPNACSRSCCPQLITPRARRRARIGTKMNELSCDRCRRRWWSRVPPSAVHLLGGVQHDGLPRPQNCPQRSRFGRPRRRMKALAVIDR